MRRQTIEIFHLLKRGNLVAYSLTEAGLRAMLPRRTAHYEIVRTTESVGLAHGQIHDWTPEDPQRQSVKLHWDCPTCGQHWWEDFPADRANPYLADSGCRCVGYWLVSWDQQNS